MGQSLAIILNCVNIQRTLRNQCLTIISTETMIEANKKRNKTPLQKKQKTKNNNEKAQASTVCLKRQKNYFLLMIDF